jgi:hypothetical protein
MATARLSSSSPVAMIFHIRNSTHIFRPLETKETSIAWDYLDTEKLLVLTNGKHSGLQVADSIASAFFCADHDRRDLCCCDWAQSLKPVMYSRNGQHRNYAVKVFPKKAENQIAQGAVAPWANQVYPA